MTQGLPSGSRGSRGSGAVAVLATVAVTCLAWTLLFNSSFVPQLTGLPPAHVEFGEATDPDVLIEAGAAVFDVECSQCHFIGRLGRGPDLAGIGTRAADRAREQGEVGEVGYLLDSLCRPAVWLVPEFANIMPPQQNRLDGGQLLATVAFLQSLGGEPSVDGSEVELIERRCGPDAQLLAVADDDDSGPVEPRSPEELIAAFGCAGCHDLVGVTRTLGPGLGDVGARLDVEGIRRAVLDPDAEVAPADPPWPAGLMKLTLDGNGFYATVTEVEIDALVEHLASLQGGG
jgi:mono/diheme cytochrome c family protein